ncbi:hypothetical protein O3P69_002738 [Scylla paramamosain]|uniref:Uncharacterized protein n=1 Tax=Scylla paramamosain TaxID=85552 RepID=A0AAW0UM11_SCYPA
MSKTEGLSTLSITTTTAPFTTIVNIILLMTLLAPHVSPAHLLISPRPHYIEEIRPVLPTNVPLMVQQQQQQPLLEAPLQVQEPRKRAAIVLDKLMFALQKALDEPSSPSHPQSAPLPPRTSSYTGPLDLQRRGNGDGRLYWRCYFNAVSCF